jgi:hypothetical protein
VTPLQWWIGVAGSLTIAVLLAGLVARRRYGSCYTFCAYLVAVLVADSLILAWPDRFFRWDFWLLKETVHSLLKFSIAMELAVRTFKGFPGARATARGVVLLVLLLALAGMVFDPVALTTSLAELATRLQPRILNAAIWLFTAIAAVILWYRLPVDAFHKAILIGFVPYLLVFTVAINALASIGWQLGTLVGYVHPAAYLLLLGYWTHAAWKPMQAPVRPAAPSPAPQPVGPPA